MTEHEFTKKELINKYNIFYRQFTNLLTIACICSYKFTKNQSFILALWSFIFRKEAIRIPFLPIWHFTLLVVEIKPMQEYLN